MTYQPVSVELIFHRVERSRAERIKSSCLLLIFHRVESIKTMMEVHESGARVNLP